MNWNDVENTTRCISFCVSTTLETDPKNKQYCNHRSKSTVFVKAAQCVYIQLMSRKNGREIEYFISILAATFISNRARSCYNWTDTKSASRLVKLSFNLQQMNVINHDQQMVVTFYGNVVISSRWECLSPEISLCFARLRKHDGVKEN